MYVTGVRVGSRTYFFSISHIFHYAPWEITGYRTLLKSGVAWLQPDKKFMEPETPAVHVMRTSKKLINVPVCKSDAEGNVPKIIIHR